MKLRIIIILLCIVSHFYASYSNSYNNQYHNTPTPIDTIYMPQGTSSFTVTNAKIYDLGGPNGNYSTNTSSVMTLYPADSCQLLQINGSLLMDYWDNFTIYDGTNINGTQLGYFTHSLNIGVSTITSLTGPLTLKFYGYWGDHAGLNLNVTSVAGCPAPSNVVSQVTDTSFSLSWVSCQGTYDQITYKELTSTNWDTITCPTNSCTISNLIPSRIYQYKMRANCGGSYSNWSDTLEAVTLCSDTFNLPFYEDFIDTATCFTFSPSNRINFAIYNFNINFPHLGAPTQNYAAIYNGSYYGTNTSGYMISPYFNNMDSGDEIQFWYFRSSQSNQPGSIQVYLNSQPSLTGAVLIREIPRYYNTAPTSAGQGFYEYRAYVPADTFKYVIFKTNSTNTAFHYFDKISIKKGSPTCPSPMNISVSNINTNSLLLNWVEQGTATHWEIEYGPSNFVEGTGTLISNINSKPYLISGLPFDQILEFRVRAIKQVGDTSAWSRGFFTSAGRLFLKSGTTSITTSQIKYYDSGGPFNNVDQNITGTLVVYPLDPHKKVAIEGSAYISGSVGIYSGTTVSGNNLASTSQIISRTGPLTININQGTNVYPGFEYNITCVDSSCWCPISFTESNISHNEASLTWAHYFNNSNVEILYKPVSDSLWLSLLVDTSLSTIITNLIPSTTYEYKMRSICAPGDTSNFSGTRTFTTDCFPLSSFYENFDTTPIDSLPTCWRKYSIYSLSKVVDTNSFTTTRCLQVTSNPYHGVILPKIPNLGNGTHQLRIRMRPNSNDFYTETLNIGYILNINNVDTFISLQSIALNSFNFYDYYFIPPTGINSNYLALKGNNISAQTIYIDEISWEPIPTCTSPISFVSTLVTDHSCDLKWESYNNSNPLAWEIQYGLSGFIPGNGISQFVQTDSVTITGLAPATYYDFYVRAICSLTDTSEWSNKLNFKTYCSYSELPVEEDFEFDFMNSSCWTQTHNNFHGNTGFTVVTSGTNPVCSPQNGSNMLRFNSFNITSGAYAVLYSPIIECNGSKILISFYQYRDNGYNYGQFLGEGIAVYSNSVPSLDGADSIGFVARQTSVNNWYLNEFLLPEGIIGQRYFLFKAISKYGNNTFVDNFKIKYLCPSPTNLTVSNVLYTEADVFWIPDSINNSCILDYKKTTENTWTSIVNITGNSYHLTNLDQNGTYLVRVRGLCDTAGMSGNTPIVSFTTLEECLLPSNIQLTDSNLLDTIATVTWTHALNSNYYEVRYKSVDVPDWIIDTTMDNYYVMNHLIPDRYYQVKIKTICSVETSDLSSNLYFLTKCKQPTDLNVLNSSVTANSAQVFWNNEDNITQWNLFYKKNTDTSWIQITVTDTFYTLTNLIPNSIYFVKIQSNCGDNNSPFSESVQFSTLTSGISQTQVHNDFTIMPNPTLDYIKITSHSDIKMIESVEIVNTVGAVIYKQYAPKGSIKIDVSEFTSGMYYVKLNTNKGVFCKKFIKL